MGAITGAAFAGVGQLAQTAVKVALTGTTQVSLIGGAGVAANIVSSVLGGAAAGALGAAYLGSDPLRGAGIGALSGLAFGTINNIGGSSWQWNLTRAGLSAAAGGGISELGGGSFEEGAAFTGAFAGADFTYRAVMNTNHEGTAGLRATTDTAKKRGVLRIGNKVQDLNANTVGIAGGKGFRKFIAGEEGPVMSFIGKNILGFQGMSHFHDNITSGFKNYLGNTANNVFFNFQSMPPAYAINAMGAAMNEFPILAVESLYGEGSN